MPWNQKKGSKIKNSRLELTPSPPKMKPNFKCATDTDFAN